MIQKKREYFMKAKFVVGLLLLASLTGCIHRKKNTSFMENFKKIDCCSDYQKTIDDVKVCVKAYNPAESEEVFGKDLLANNIQPIQLCIQNNSNDTLTIYPSYIQLEGLPAEIVAPLIKKKISKYIAPLAVATWLFQPILIYIPIQMGLDMRRNNKKMAERLTNGCYASTDPINIYPWTTFQKFIFVDLATFNNSFYIRLFNEEKKKLLHYDVLVQRYINTIEEDSNKRYNLKRIFA